MSMSKSADGLSSLGPTNPLNFTVGQLAVVLIDTAKLPSHADGFIGKIESIDDLGNVVLRNFLGQEALATLSNLKQAVHFDVSRNFFVEEGRRGEVFVIDHPDPMIFPNEWVTTSTVLSVRDSGCFETRNTYYMINKFGPMMSPYLS